MFRPRIIPTLLLQGEGLVKTVQFRKPTYIGDPMNAVKIFNESRADELVFLDIAATKEGRLPDLALIESISDEAYMPFAVGGGISKIAHVKDIISRGAEKVVINSALASSLNLVSEAAGIFGSQSVIASVDIGETFFGTRAVLTHNGSRKVSTDPVAFCLAVEKAGAGEILLTAIKREGTYKGYDLELTRSVADAVKIPVIASGGAGSLSDMQLAVSTGGASAAAAGSIFVYHGKQRGILINYPTRTEFQEVFASP